MKKKLFVLLIFIALAGNSLCLSGQIYLGPFAGYSNGKFIGDPPPQGIYGWKPGSIWGIKADFPVSTGVYISTKPAYSFQSAKYMILDVNGDKLDSVTHKLQSVSLPLGITIYSTNENFNVYCGLQAFLPTKYRQVSSGYNDKDLSDKIRDYTVAAQFSIAYNIHINSARLNIEMAYVQTLSNAFTNDLLQKDDYLNRVKIQSLNFNIIYQVPLNPKKHLLQHE